MTTIYNKPISELIQLRHSVRNYEDTPLSVEIMQQIESYIQMLDNPFNQSVRIKLIQKNLVQDDVKLGTYGVIKGANYFLVAACENDDLAYIALGYALEKVILYCTSLGLGTVWLGGTFNKSHFAKAMNLSVNEVLPIVSPLGYEGGKKSIIASLFGSNTNKRKDFSELFFNQNFDTPLTQTDSDMYANAFEMVRLAPSAMNKQPWRLIKEGQTIHFYLANTAGLTKIDLGIALCHFHLTAIENGIDGHFKLLNGVTDNTDHKYTYFISWIN